ncbi:MAG: CinA family protein [Sandaracinobacter sp.]
MTTPPLTFETLVADAKIVTAALAARRQTVAVAESSTGGLVSAALLAHPGASAWFLGGGIIYTPRARHRLLDLKREDVQGLRGASEPYARVLAERTRSRFAATWGLGETGATGPSANPYGDPPGHCCYAITGPAGTVSQTLETGNPDRLQNMLTFSRHVLAALLEQVTKSN